ncbi:MAG: helix-turn-helix transcriptional regulator [bacterium]|nr:helix-turn-helix transcriptional regulator [Candidatus Kapabacteria bacterium]
MSDQALSDLRPCGYLWDGGLVGFGPRFGVVPPHSHHAVQISIALEGTARARSSESDEWLDYSAVVIAADAVHSFDRNDAMLAMIFVDPESLEGRWLAKTYGSEIAALPESRIESCREKLIQLWRDPPDADGVIATIAGGVRGMCSGIAPTKKIDERILKALDIIRSIDVLRISLEEIADAVFLSPSRFAHLFSDELGLPFRRYVLWRKMTRALYMVAHGETLSSAAHASGFSDSAHLTRSCYQMFGVAPTHMVGTSELFVIPAPFELPFVAA